jgi:hypothetical protein
MFNKQSWLAAIGGTAIGALTLYFLQSIPLIALIPFPLAGVGAVALHRFALSQHVTLEGGAVVGLQTGILMSVLVIIWTIIVTGVGHYEFAAAVIYAPFIICSVCVFSGLLAAFFVRTSA